MKNLLECGYDTFSVQEAKKLMPKGQNKKASLKSSYSSTVLLLVKFILITIGKVPLLAISYSLLAIRRILSAKFPTNRLSHITYHFLQRNRTRGRPKKMRISRKTKAVIGLSLLLTFFLTYTFFLLTAAYELPTPTRLVSSRHPLTTEFLNKNGKLLYRLYDGSNRSLVQLSEVPQNLINATIAVEDQNFYRHPGIDPLAIGRAIYNNFTKNTKEGASTITQQLIKNSLLTPERTYSRKTKEIILALWADFIYPKEKILQMYFNEAPYGGSLLGVAAAAQTYFGKSPAELNLAESAYLAGLPVSPTQFSPYGENPQLGKLRQKDVLEKMMKLGFITKAVAQEAYAWDLKIKPLVSEIRAPHFVMYARNLLAQKYGERIVSQGGLKVYTTVDLPLQERIEEIVKEEVEKIASLNVQNGAAIVTDKNGQILAMSGSKDYRAQGFGNYNVTIALRQPGSAIKVVTYATAFKKGFSPANTVLDTPVSFGDGAGTYSPVNYDGRFHGPVSVRTALAASYNIPAVRLAATLGVDEIIKTAKDMGISTFNQREKYGLSLTLGAAEVKMIDMISVYGTLANLGVKMYPTPFLKVVDSNGNILEEFRQEGTQVLDKEIAYLLTDILKDNKARTPAFGPNSLLNIPGFEVAVKTGTADWKTDNSIYGYTPKYVAGAWVGNPDNSPMKPALTSGVTGAAPIWNKIMHLLLDNTKPLAFERPTGISEATIDGRKDLTITGVIPKSLVRVRKNEDKMVFSDTFSSYAAPSSQPDFPDSQATLPQPNL